MFKTKCTGYSSEDSEGTGSSSSNGTAPCLHKSPLGLTLKLCDFGASRSVAPLTSSSVHQGNICFCFFCKDFGVCSRSCFLSSPPLLALFICAPFFHLFLLNFVAAACLGHIPYEEIGTPGYLSPEHLQREPLSTAIDSWSSGVVFYQCISGYLPFRPATACFDGPPKMDGPLWSGASQRLMLLVQRLLNVDPYLRLTAQEAAEYPWLSCGE